MENVARYGIAVTDLDHSVAFYRDQIGLCVDTETGTPDTALLTTAQGHRFLLAGPGAPGWREILASEHTVLERGEKIFMWDPEFERRLARFTRNGAMQYSVIERPWGDRIIEAEDPDGHGVSLMAIIERSPEDVRGLLDDARIGLREQTQGLASDELSWRPGPDSWSIKEIVHHLADSSLTVLHVARVALAEPGKQYHGNPFDQNRYATELRYQERDIEPSLALFEATEDVLCSMVEAVPDSWSRAVTTPSGETTVKTYLEMLAIHALEHLEQIGDVRRAMDEWRSP